MLRLFILLQTTLLRAGACLSARSRSRRADRGSVTTEHVLWAVAVIAIAGIVVAAVKAYVTTQAGSLK